MKIISSLANYRRQSSALTEGKMVQFAPQNGIYAYARFTEKQRILIVSNTNDKEMDVKMQNYDEILRGGKMAKNILTDEILNDISVMKIPAKTVWVLEILPSDIKVGGLNGSKSKF